MRITFIGSGDAFGSGGRFQACILVEVGGRSVLLDCGASSLIAIKRQGIDPNTIEAVAVSHLHGDHFGGIPFLVLNGQFSRRESPLLVVGPPGTHDRVMATMEALYPGSSLVQRRFDVLFEELEPAEPFRFAGGTIEAFAVDHASGAPPYAYRLEVDGKTIAYSGDTAWNDALIAASREADLFICEGYRLEREVPYHLSIAALAVKRAQLACDRIVLTHMSQEVLDAPPEGWECASDGLVIDL